MPDGVIGTGIGVGVKRVEDFRFLTGNVIIQTISTDLTKLMRICFEALMRTLQLIRLIQQMQKLSRVLLPFSQETICRSEVYPVVGKYTPKMVLQCTSPPTHRWLKEKFAMLVTRLQ
jgi:hypothetical protein